MSTWNNLSTPRGFLFIGDPHVSSVRPGKRVDDFAASVLGKLAQAARIATERQLVPVILGDLIHRDDERSIGLCSRLMLVLQQFPCTPLELDGNHGKREAELVEEDIEFLLQTSGSLQVLQAGCEPREFDFGGQRVMLHAAAYGTVLPARLPRLAETVNVLITHHDLAFEGAYPGAAKPFEIPGCAMVVNGHMHKTAPSIDRGETTWHCPGNIEPLSVDVREHKPAVWEWTPENGVVLAPHYLDHDFGCFGVAVKSITASGAGEAAAALEEQISSNQTGPTPAPSKFAALLAGSQVEDQARTDEAAYLGEDLEAVLADLTASPATAQVLRTLAAAVAKDAADAATPA